MLNEIASYIKERRAIQKATQPLEYLIYCEKLCIESAIKRAELRIKQQLLIDQVGKDFMENIHRLLKVEGQAATMPQWQPVPVFTAIHDPDPTIAEAIAVRLKEMKDDRETFLRNTKRQLERNPQLNKAFIELMQETEAGHYLAALR